MGVMELNARLSHLARPATMTVALGAMLALLAGTTDADAAKRKRYPVVTSVSPMNAKVGDTITIRGRYFVRGKNKNSVVFKRDGARAVFAKQTLGTAKQIRVVVPEALRSYLKENVPSVVRLRVLSERFGKKFTATAKSPRITGSAVMRGDFEVAVNFLPKRSESTRMRTRAGTFSVRKPRSASGTTTRICLADRKSTRLNSSHRT